MFGAFLCILPFSNVCPAAYLPFWLHIAFALDFIPIRLVGPYRVRGRLLRSSVSPFVKWSAPGGNSTPCAVATPRSVAYPTTRYVVTLGQVPVFLPGLRGHVVWGAMLPPGRSLTDLL